MTLCRPPEVFADAIRKSREEDRKPVVFFTYFPDAPHRRERCSCCMQCAHGAVDLTVI